MEITNLRIGNIPLVDGVWIDEEIPCFSFAIEEVDEYKESYHCRLTLYHEKEFMWEHRIATDNFLNIQYTGERLKSFEIYTLEISVDKFRVSKKFNTAFLGEFEHKWIGFPDEKSEASPVFSYGFDALSVKQAVLVICGLGLYEVKLNGCEVTDTLLNPPHTMYDKNAKYNVYDITRLIYSHNEIRITLGNGFFNEGATSDFLWHAASWRGKPSLFAQIRLIDNSGNQKIINADENWLVSDSGPLRLNSIYFGEYYDARKEEIPEESFVNARIVPVPTNRLRLQTPPFI